MTVVADQGDGQSRGWLDIIERVGNRLPDPTTLFVGGLLLLCLASAAVATLQAEVQRPVPVEPRFCQEQADIVRACSLLTGDGGWWLLSNLVGNFIGFAPLGVVLVGMLGIGLAERVGLVRAALIAGLRFLPRDWLAGTVLLLGVLSSLGLDAGYVVLPPLAAALFQQAGRSPLAGIAVAFAGVSAGFSANLVVTALDPLLAGITTENARIIDPEYTVAATANLWFMMASTPLLVLAGWWANQRFVERRLPALENPDARPEAEQLSPTERRALAAAGLCLLVLVVVVAAMVFTPGAVLYADGSADRLIIAAVPLLMLLTLLPGLCFGFASGSLRSDRDVARKLGEVMSELGPYIVLAFFAAQFIAAFRYSGLGEMLAILGGQALAGLALPTVLVVLLFVIVSAGSNLLIGSASAKYALLAPVFVPMLMVAGISPEMTQAGYRVGDSVTNIITPFNPYMIIIIAQVRRYLPNAGVGTVVSMMLPFALTFAVAWGLLLAGWVTLALPLGP